MPATAFEFDDDLLEVEATQYPSDDAIWRGRERTREAWQWATGIGWHRLARHFRRRGFGLSTRRGRGFEASEKRDPMITSAPCLGCRARFKARNLSSIRLCDECGEGTPETLCRRELRRWRRNHPTHA